MKKFEILKESVEIRTNATTAWTAEEVFNAYRNNSSFFAPALVEAFETKEEAIAAWDKIYRGWGSTSLSRGSTGLFLDCVVVFLLENHYDENGNFDQGGDVLRFAAEGYNPEEKEE